MEVSEDHLAGPDAFPLGFYRLLHLHDQVGRRQIFGVAETAADTGSRFHDHAVSGRNQRLDTCRNQRDAVLVSLDFFWNAHSHQMTPAR